MVAFDAIWIFPFNFTFKKTGQQIAGTSGAPKFGPSPGGSGTSTSLSASRGKQVAVPPVSAPTANVFKQIKQNPLKDGLQTSMLSFTRNKQVAAVLPQRPKESSHSSQEKKNLLEKNKESFVLNEMPIEIFEDDDDFEMTAFSQSSQSLRYILLYRLCGLAIKTLAQGSGGTGSIPGRVKPKTLKLVLVADPPGVWHYGFSAESGRPGVRIM
ncbi:hypothetical protein ElyMa_004754500 [Elysia marginata]|uniref:Uncharacterized protein n=1 Tax=Elysia marginata TaxID=1093978 RepID=A0AAV4IG15_9GAST|nr:hypothetical protein ElyMa_004754500 [Elysia marginata]